MLLSIFTFIYVIFSLVAIGSGAIVLFGLLTGELLEKPAVLFLRYTLFASVTGLLSSLHHPLPTQGLSMLLVNVTAAPILAWRKFHLAGVWHPIFAFSASIVLFLNVVVTSNLIFIQTPLSKSLLLAPFRSPLFVAQMVVMVLFVALGIVAAKRFRDKPQAL